MHLGVWVGEETWVRAGDSARASFMLVGVLLPVQATRTSPGASLGLLGLQQGEPDAKSSRHAAPPRQSHRADLVPHGDIC